jgi:hypothetical protein
MTIDAWRAAVEEERRTLESLRRLDDHPLYTMSYHGPTPPLWVRRGPPPSGAVVRDGSARFACSIFVGADGGGRPVIGRNFDWPHAPALALSTFPTDGYASLAFIDLPDLGVTGAMLDDPQGTDARARILSAPLLPLDGMNERGLVVTMASVGEWSQRLRAGHPIASSVAVLRPVLDHAATVAEGLEILAYYDIDPEDEPPLHYLLADAAGESAIVEFTGGRMQVLDREEAWHLMVNFNLSTSTPEERAADWRWCAATERLAALGGTVDVDEAMRVLAAVQQDDTQWSTVYEPTKGVVHAAMGRRYDTVHRFEVGRPAALTTS